MIPMMDMIYTYYTMSAQNENTEMITITDTITEVVAVAVDVMPEELMPVTLAEILDTDFRNDDEAEFLQAVLEIQQEIENVLLSDSPEDFLLPTENDLPPAIIFLEKLEELKSYAFGDRTIARMERRIRGVNEVVRTKLTETEKASHPDYRKCPECLRHFTKRYLGFHMGTDICVKVKTAHNLRPSGNNKTKVSEKIYNACYDLEDLYARAVAYRRNIEPELVEEEIEVNTEMNTECKSCGWGSEYQDLHILYCGGSRCEYIRNKYKTFINENGEMEGIAEEREVRYRHRCVYQEDEGDDYYEDELSWEGKDFYTTEEEGMAAIGDAWINWSAEAGEDLKFMELIAYEVKEDDTGNEWIVHTYKINNEEFKIVGGAGQGKTTM